MKEKRKIDVSEWIDRSFENLKTAKVSYEDKLYNPSVFHCHQAIELILKACWLQLLRRTPPTGRRGHNLSLLYSKSLQRHVKLTKEQTEFLIDLTPHYYNSRYPELLWNATRSYTAKCLRNTEAIIQCCAKKLS